MEVSYLLAGWCSVTLGACRVFSRRACRPRLAENWDDNVHKCGYSLNVAYLDGDKKAAALVPKMFTSGMSYRQAKNAAKARK